MLGCNPHQLITCRGFHVISEPFQETTLLVEGGEEGQTERNATTCTGHVFALINGGKTQQDLIWTLLWGLT